MRTKPYVQPVIVELEVKKAVEAVSLALISTIPSGVKFEFGPYDDIIKFIQLGKNAVPSRLNYPLIAMFGNPDDVIVTNNGSGYLDVVIKTIDIAMVTNSSNSPTTRINETFIPTLYPIYTEFLNQLGRLPNIVERDAEDFKCSLKKVYGTQPNKLTDYLDILEITNLSFKTTLNKTCLKS